MSISNEALQKLLREIETNHVKSQQEISLARSQLASKQREKRLAQLTSTEISSLAPGTPLYEGVGKIGINDASIRFVSIPAPELKDKLESQTKQVDTDIDGLSKRLHYLETTAKNSQEHIEAMLRRGGAGAS
ncbi:prefoldin subunit 1 [Diaporthe eres]|nr:prefoldin subunit 1 [Diaporthe eres]